MHKLESCKKSTTSLRSRKISKLERECLISYICLKFFYFTPDSLREDMGLPPTTSLKKIIPKDKYCMIEFTDMLARRCIERENIRGFVDCYDVYERAVCMVRPLLEHSQKNPSNKAGRFF